MSDRSKNDRLPVRIAKLVPVEDAERVTGQPLPDLLATKGVELVTRKWPGGRSEDALRVPLRLIARR